MGEEGEIGEEGEKSKVKNRILEIEVVINLHNHPCRERHLHLFPKHLYLCNLYVIDFRMFYRVAEKSWGQVLFLQRES